MNVLYHSSWLLIRLVTKALFRIRVSGVENIPKTGGFIVAANHISYFDPPLIGCWVPREMYYFAKQELFKSRLFGALLQRVNARPVKRGAIDRQALKTAVDAIARGYGLAIFPEGTRSGGGDFLSPKPGVGMIAREAKCPIVPCYVHGTNKLSKCLWGRQRLSITFGEPLTPGWVSSFPDRKDAFIEIAQTIMRRIAALRDRTLRQAHYFKEVALLTENKKRKKRLKFRRDLLYNLCYRVNIPVAR
ncbi:MAG: lysophospholipid acyltransferase family protein [Candidatus Zixiibacteriota bacterium]